METGNPGGRGIEKARQQVGVQCMESEAGRQGTQIHSKGWEKHPTNGCAKDTKRPETPANTKAGQAREVEWMPKTLKEKPIRTSGKQNKTKIHKRKGGRHGATVEG